MVCGWGGPHGKVCLGWAFGIGNEAGMGDEMKGRFPMETMSVVEVECRVERKKI